MANPRNAYAAPSVYQLPVGSTSSAPYRTPSPSKPEPQLGSYGGLNSYNTPNVNTYVAPGGRFASGLGDNTPGLNGMIAAHQRQQMLNGLSASDANQLRLGGARPEAPASRTRVGFIGRPSRAYVALTNQESPGSEAALNNVSVGGSGGAFASAAQRQKQASENYKALLAKRFANRNGGAALAAARSGAAVPAPTEFPAPVAIGANGLPLTAGAPQSKPLEGGGRVGPSMTFPQAGAGQPPELQKHFGLFEQPLQRMPYIAPPPPGQRFIQGAGQGIYRGLVHTNPLGLTLEYGVPWAADQYYGTPPVANPNASGQIPRYRGPGVGYYQ